MQRASNIEVLFITGFGPVVRDSAESRKLYSDALGIRFKVEKEESADYLHTEALQGAKTSRCGLFPRPRTHVLVATHGLTTFPCRKHGWNSMSTASRVQRPTSSRGDIEFSSGTERSPGVKR